jgi:hypothetical protein
LKQRITELETELERYRLETDRVLQLIREELDDVLMREINGTIQ